MPRRRDRDRRRQQRQGQRQQQQQQQRGLPDETPKIGNRQTARYQSTALPDIPMRNDSSFADRFRTQDDDISYTMEPDEGGIIDEDDASLSSRNSNSSSEEEQEEDLFHDEDYNNEASSVLSSTPSAVIELTGMETVEEIEQQRQAALAMERRKQQQQQQQQGSSSGSSSTSSESSAFKPRDSAINEGPDVLKGYMNVMHGRSSFNDDEKHHHQQQDEKRHNSKNKKKSPMESKIKQGLTKSTNSSSDFFLNSDNMSIGSKSTRQSRAVMIKVAQRIDFLQDNPEEMTYTRQIALYLMNKYKWYNPRLGKIPPSDEQDDEPTDNNLEGETNEADDNHDSKRNMTVNIFGTSHANHNNDSLRSISRPPAFGGAYRSPDGYPMLKTKPETPSLEEAWAYFEHFTLTRYVYEPKMAQQKSLCTRIRRKFQKGDKEFERAERNENILPTKLYDPIWTPHNQLGDWGIGWGLYFASLRGLMILLLVGGICSIPNMAYFSTDEYSSGESVEIWWLAASAICTSQDWVPCPDCEYDTLPNERLAYVYFDQYNVNLTYALKNNCNGATTQVGFCHLGTLGVILIGLFILNRYLMRMEAIFEEDEQTTQNYTILIENPPPDATDPEEWRNFFITNLGVTHVVAVTVAVDNDELVKKLVERRECMKRLELLLEPGTVLEMNNLAGIAAKVDRERGALESLTSMIISGIPELFRRIVVLTIEARGLAQHNYPAKRVFVTFETESDQRRILTEMAVGSYYANNNDKSVVKDPKHLFRGEHMLYIEQPQEEPNSYRWISMNERFLDRLWQQILTSIATFASILLVAFIVRLVNDVNTVFSAFAISIFNGAFPEFAKILTKFEGHSTEAAVQTSMYVKICLFRWTNTAIVITIITPFTSTLIENGGLINQIYAIFFTEIFTMNAFQLADFPGHFMRHFMAPRAKTQDEMNIYMKGLEVELAERYTNLTKIVFLALWYSAIYPAGFFMGSFALFVNYFTDRHSLMRTWKRSPALGPGISEFSRRYFVTTSFLAMALLSSAFFSGYPFDNLCQNEEPLPVPFDSATYTLQRYFSNETTDIVVGNTNNTYRFCTQDFFRLGAFPFFASNQPEGDEWMTEEQEQVANAYAYATIGAILFVACMFISGWIEHISRAVWGESAGADRDDQRINFSDVTNISAYIPHVPSDVFSYPLFVTSMNGIGEEIIDWRDPLRPHAFYDLTLDAEKILEGIDISNQVIFSQMKHWPPQVPQEEEIMKASLLGGPVSDNEDLSESDSEIDSIEFP